ncbi:Oxysterol-binding protein-domain-containing protein [Aspergillus filifer]
MSLDQSVRTFRLFEVLRSGDTTAISKAIKESKDPQGANGLSGTTILHLAIQCAEPQVVEYVLSAGDDIDINARDREGNTPLHLAAQLGRGPVVRELLNRPGINDSIVNYRGQTPLEASRAPEIFQQLQLARSLFIDEKTRELQALIGQGDYDSLEKLLEEPRVEGILDVNALDLVTDPATTQSGGTLLHEGARKKDTKLIQILLMHGADPFRRDKKGKLPQDVTKDDKTRAIVKKSPAAVMAQRGIQEKAILGTSSGQGVSGRPGAGDSSFAGKDSREMKGYLKKWTNYTSGYKLRWFVLEDGVLSYYKHQDDAGSACRGAINMKIARLNMDSQDKTRFEIHGKSSVKYHLKANHVVEAKRWFWTLNNAIQYSKDEAKEEEKRQTKNAETLRQAKMDQIEGRPSEHQSEVQSVKSSQKGLAPMSLGVPSSSGSKLSPYPSRTTLEGVPDEDASMYGSLDQGPSQSDINRVTSHVTTAPDLEGEDEDYADYDSSHETPPTDKDAMNITAQSAKLQLEILANVASSLQAEKSKNPTTTLSDQSVDSALTAYEGAVSSLKDLVQNLLKISRDRDSYWQYRLNREAYLRKMWEESMARIAQEHDELQSKMGESEEKRRRTKRALKEALESTSTNVSRNAVKAASHEAGFDGQEDVKTEALEAAEDASAEEQAPERPGLHRKKSALSKLSSLYDSESDEEEEEFFDAIDAGEVEVVDRTAPEVHEEEEKAPEETSELRAVRRSEIAPSFKGYEEPIRERLKMDYDNRPKISLWGILKSMIGKDMTKMTLPVSFNEPTSLLQRVAEDLEYTDLLDVAADQTNSMERLVYVAAYAASEYASTIGRVAKPFNPLLGETFEYVRPDKGYRFFVEQVSHHPPIGVALAESPKWDYWGESSLKSKFYGKSFDINLLGTWFLKLRPASGGEELYTWKKVTSSVIGIITGNPTVDNYGLMEIKNWTTGEVCYLDFKPRGWKASSAYQVTGKVVDQEGSPKWSIGGRWNDKIYARHTPGFEAPVSGQDPESAKTILVWQAHPRPTGVPFNLTPFVITLNSLTDSLKPQLPPTDTRLRPDQRAMEEGEYDFAATEKHRVEEKQRAKRRERETNGEEYKPKWFSKDTCPITGEEYWKHTGDYWGCRAKGDWSKALRRNIATSRSTLRSPHVANSRRAYGSSATLTRGLETRSHNCSVSSNSVLALKRASSLKLPLPSLVQKANSASFTRNSRELLKPNNLFHKFSESPSQDIWKRAAFIKQNAFCPHPSHQQTRAPVSPHDPEARKVPTNASLPPAHSHYECPDCGIPIYCSEEHWMEDYEAHLEVCETLRQINEDDHDLHSGRFFPEFSYPGLQDENFVINMTNWDTFLYTREFDAINDDRSMRQVTRMLTYPMTIGSVLHELSPYSIRKDKRLTAEGLKSISALRYSLHPPRTGEGTDIQGLRVKAPPVRLFVLGARAESSLPRDVWLQLSHIFPRSLINIIFIGPESMANRDDEFPLPERTPSNPFGGIVEDRLGGQMKITTYVDYFHTMYKANYFQPFDPYLDCIVLFHPGLGHPASSHEWEETLPMLLETKVPIITTGYTQWDMERDINWVHEKCAGEFDMLLEPGENIFRSLRWDLNDLDPHDVSCGNWGLWAFRGKRYEATFKDS